MSIANANPLERLLQNVPASALKKTVDEVMFDYACTSIRDQQTQTPEEAVSHLLNMKMLRDSLTNSDHT